MNDLTVLSVGIMGALAVVFAAVLAFADKKLKVKEDPKVEELNRLLPGVNCGACGFLSCRDFAEKIVTGEADPAKCRVVDEETAKKIFAITGRSKGKVYPKLPLVYCAAEEENKKPLAEYLGVRTCNAAKLIFGGGMECQYGCMGFGDCVEVCSFDALIMVKGLPRVDIKKCTGCAKCVKACPRNIIEMAEKKNEKLFYVACSSHDNALRVRKICGVGCIACGICEKLSSEKFFVMKENLSRRDAAKHNKKDKQEEIEKIAGKCPTKVIKHLT
ncbi:MAG: RnfABCDGE type electron transport complex subunit B [Candidatus Omnitrophota bacterium]